MLALDNGDAIRGDASAADVIDYTLHGVVSAKITPLADGQLGDSEADLYPAIANATIITAITLVNTDTSTRTVNLYLKPSGRTSRRIIPKGCSLPAGYSLATDGVKVYITSTSGAVVVTNALHAASHTDGTDDIRDATAAQKGVATAAQITKLDAIAAGADVTADNAPKAHKDSHDPIDGSDKLDSAAPVKVGSANAIGSSHSLSRADHVHEREHAKYTNAEAKAAAVQAGAITDEVTKAPTHDAVYPIAVLAAAALPATDRYDDEEAVAAMGDKANDNPLHHDRTVKYTNGEAVSAVEAAGLALASGKNIKVVSALTTNQTWSGLTAILTAGEALTIGRACYMKSDGKMWKSLATVVGTMPVVALATGTIAADAVGEFLLIGFFREDSVFNFTAGDMLYASEDTAGALKNAAPTTTGEQVQVCGKCFPSAHIIYFNPSLELVEQS